MNKALTGVAGLILFAGVSTACGSKPSDNMVQVCIEVATNQQVDEDHCEEGESEFDATRYGIVWLRESLVTNRDAIVEPETDETKKKPTPKATTKKATTTTTRRR